MGIADADREHLLKLLAAATFVIFFQAYMIAPIIPQLGFYFDTPIEVAGAVVPAYLIPYGVATLIYGLIADRVGIRRVMLFSLSAFVILTLLTVTSPSIHALITWRTLTGLGASGMVPMALVFVGMQYPYETRGRPLGWLFGAMAGGMAFGSSLGAFLEPFIGWRGLFVVVGISGAVVLYLLIRPVNSTVANNAMNSSSVRSLVGAYWGLLITARGARTYGYVFANSVFHSGVFTWLGVYLEQRYSLGALGVGFALLGYGIPGFLFGPLIGRMADKYGRGRLLPVGLLISALSAAFLIGNPPLIAVAISVMFLSLGYDMTQPLLGGIVTTLGGQRPGQAMGLNVFMLFVGFGVGSLLFGRMLSMGFGTALTVFVLIEVLLAIASLRLFRTEIPRTTTV